MTIKFDEPQDERETPVNDDDEKLEARLRAVLYRQDCPETMVLGEYRLGLLAEPEAARLAAHLARCPHCQAELSRLTEFLAEESLGMPTPSVGESSPWTRGDGFEWRQLKEAGRIVIRFIEETLNSTILNLQQGVQPFTGQPNYGGLRSSRQTLFEATLKEGIEDFEAIITVDTKGYDLQFCTITVDVNIPSQGGWPHLADTEVTMKRGDLALQTEVTDAFGKVVFKNVARDELGQLSFEITPSI